MADAGYINRAVPKSKREALVSALSHDQIKTRVKASLEAYLRSFLDTEGANRSVLSTISPRSLTWITNQSASENPTDPLYRRTQLSRMYENVKAEAPAVLLVDTSMKWQPPGIGNHLGGSQLRDGLWIGRYDVTAQVGISIGIVTTDQESTDTLTGTLLMLLGTFRNLSGGSELRTKGSNFVVRLPLTLEVGQTQRVQIGDGPTDSIWTTSTDVILDYEDSVYVSADWNNTAEQAGGTVNAQLTSAPTILTDATMPIGQQTKIRVVGWQPHRHSIYITDPKMAVLDTKSLIVTPRRLGSFTIVIADGQGIPLGGSLAPTVLTEKTIRAVL